MQKEKQVKKTYSQKPHKYQNTFQKLITSCTSKSIYYVIGDFRIWPRDPSNKKHDKHWVIFTRYVLVMQNIVHMSFMYHTKSIIKTNIHAKNTENLCIKKSHGHMICINIKNCGMIRDSKRMNISKYIKYLHDIFIKVPKSPTENTKNIKSRLQAVFW